MTKSKMKQEELVVLLKDAGIKPSVQRLMILDYLVKNYTHPTVDVIYQALYKEIPTLSKTTVYNTLDLFSQHNLVQKIFIEENEIRYDVNTDVHGHFKCVDCGKISDFEINHIDSKMDQLAENKIIAREVYYRGICQTCLAK